MAQPAFIDRLRQRNLPAEEQPDPPPRATFDSANPFDRASADLARRWDQMVVDLEAAQAEAEWHRGENVHLGSEVDRLRQELATRISFFEVELDRVTQRADRAVNDATAIRAKLTVIAQAIRMVLDEEQAVAKREPRQEPTRESSIPAPPPRNLSTMQRPAPVRDFAQTPPEGHDVSEADAEDARDLINRLAPVALKR